MGEKKNWYCSAPFRSVYLNDGIVRPCCWYDRKYIKNRNQSLSTMESTFLSDEFAQIRSISAKGEVPDGCSKCVNHEKSGGKSHRMYWNQRESEMWKDLPAEPFLTGLDIDMGNLCNLKCVMCNSHNSTLWVAEEKRLGLPVNFEGKKSVETSGLDPKYFKNMTWIKFAGGEVLLMPEHEVMLNFFIESDLAKNLNLSYVVNNSISPQKFLERWKQFKSVKLFLSIDGIGEVYNYIRYPAKFEDHKENIKEYLKSDFLDIQVNCTVSSYNILHLLDLDRWWLDVSGGREIFYRVLNFPEIMSIRNLSQEQKGKVNDLYKDHPRLSFLLNELKQEPIEDFQCFLEFVEKQEAGRSVKFSDLNPQLI